MPDQKSNTYILTGLREKNELPNNVAISFDIKGGRVDVRVDKENDVINIYCCANGSEKVFIQPTTSNVFQIHFKQFNQKP